MSMSLSIHLYNSWNPKLLLNIWWDETLTTWWLTRNKQSIFLRRVSKQFDDLHMVMKHVHNMAWFKPNKNCHCLQVVSAMASQWITIRNDGSKSWLDRWENDRIIRMCRMCRFEQGQPWNVSTCGTTNHTPSQLPPETDTVIVLTIRLMGLPGITWKTQPANRVRPRHQLPANVILGAVNVIQVQYPSQHHARTVPTLNWWIDWQTYWFSKCKWVEQSRYIHIYIMNVYIYIDP